jgi:DNA primase large subunit
MSSVREIPQVFFFEFPWLNGSFEVLLDSMGISHQDIENLGLIDTVKMLFSHFSDLKDRILSFIQNAVENKEMFPTPTNDLGNLAMYPILQIIISALGNRILSNAMANIYAKHCQSLLEVVNARSKISDYLIKSICENVGIICEVVPRNFIDGTEYPFRMEFTSYLHASTKINDPAWKLINRILLEGKVFLIRHDVILLLREFVRLKVKPDFSQVDKKILESLETYDLTAGILKEIEVLIAANTKRFDSSLSIDGETIGSEFFPPCIKNILYRVVHGENLSHMERLAIAFFYLNTNHTVEETVDIFRTSPDFDEKIARYQVEFVSGASGKGKKYAMYSCAKMKTLHLCKAEDPQFGEKLCSKGAKKKDGTILPIKNPARDYIFWKKVELNRIHHSQVAVIEEVLQQDTENEENKNDSAPKSRVKGKRQEDSTN